MCSSCGIHGEGDNFYFLSTFEHVVCVVSSCPPCLLAVAAWAGAVRPGVVR